MVGLDENIKRTGVVINLQRFADGGSATDDDTLDDSELDIGGDSWTPPASKDEFTKKLREVSIKAAKKKERSLLRSLGVETLETAKTSLKKLGEIEASSMSEVEKYTKQIEELTKTNSELSSKLGDMETDTKLLSSGVDGAKLQKAKALLSAYTGEKLDDKIKAFLADEDNAPFLVQKQKGGTLPIKQKTSDTSGKELSTLEAQRLRLGIKKK